jgi:DNA-binding response OmpR family regulator
MTSGPVVLLVDPFQDEREMYAEFLRHHQLTVEDFERPEEAMRSLADTSPDVLVTDFVLHSDMSGLEFIRAARRQMDAAASILVVSGYTRVEDGEQAKRAGADRFLIKPAFPRDVLHEVRRALARRQEGRRLDWSWTFTPPPDPIVERRHHHSPPSSWFAADAQRKAAVR